MLNVKKLRLKSYAPHPVQLRLLKSGAGAVTAPDIEPNADVEIVNPDQHLLTLDSGDAPIEIDMTVERGVGYLAAERCDQLPIGVIPVDAIFSPVRKVNYTVENTRVGQMTNFDKLTIEIETDGTLSPEEALVAGGRDPRRPVQPVHVSRQADARRRAGIAGRAVAAGRTCSTCRSRSSICRCAPTTRSSATTSSRSASCCSLQDEDLLRMRNFGKKSLDEMKERLRMRGFLPPDDGLEGGRLRCRGWPRRAGYRRGRGARWRTRSVAASSSRKTGPRKALYRNLIVSVLRYEQIKTTEARAKEVRGQVERVITLAKKGSLASRRQIIAELPNEPLVIDKLINEIAPKYGRPHLGLYAHHQARSASR